MQAHLPHGETFSSRQPSDRPCPVHLHLQTESTSMYNAMAYVRLQVSKMLTITEFTYGDTCLGVPLMLG